MWPRYDKSWVENFLSFWTPLLLAVLAVTSLLLRFARDPVTCHYVYPAANEYFGEYCFHETSIQMRSDEFVKFIAQASGKFDRNAKNNPNPFELWPKQRTYHQWVPFALGLGALLCLLPHILWRILNGFLWMDNHGLVQTIAANQSESSAGHHVTYKDSALVVRAGLRGGNWMLSVAALARKALACGVCLLQVVLVVIWFKPPLAGRQEEKQDLSSVNVTAPDVLEDVPLPVDPFFCTVKTTTRMNVQTMTMQCMLPLNQVFVKAFIFLFYFFLILLALCLWDVFYWLGRLFLPRLRDVTLLRNLSIIDLAENGHTDYHDTTDFLQFLGPDGRLMLALVVDHCGSVAAVRFTGQLWKAFKGQSRLLTAGSAPLSPNSAPMARGMGGSGMMEEVGHAAGHRSNAGDIPLQDVSELPHTDKDTAQLCPL